MPIHLMLYSFLAVRGPQSKCLVFIPDYSDMVLTFVWLFLKDSMRKDTQAITNAIRKKSMQTLQRQFINTLTITQEK